MRLPLLPLLLTLLTLPALAVAQGLGYKEHLRLAERFETAGDFANAAEQYLRAYEAKPKKSELAYKAAEYFYLTKDYARAAEAYAPIRREWRDYPLAGLRYARSLKQDARFNDATAAYKDYLSYYGGDDLPLIRRIVENEVRGAAMAQQSLREVGPAIVVEPLAPVINGPGNEAAPMPLSAQALYFLRAEGGLMRMYRSVRTASGYAGADRAADFPVVPGMHVGSGSLNPDGTRFYFGLCKGREVPTQPTARCGIYVIERVGDAWTAPQPLPSYINTAGNSTAHPYLYREGEIEVMLFASDRLDGHGGMDLYRAERRLDSEGTDFTYPENLGPVVNGVGDEVSPHYDPVAQVLHFASNGYLNMGGYDVFRTMGGRRGFNAPENLGAPVNSPADDYYYRPVPGTREAVLSSNRAVRDAKTRTSNEDLFLVRPGAPTMAVRLQVVDSATSESLAGATLAAFTREGGRERLVTSARTEDGYFALDLPMGAAVELRVQREGYTGATRRVDVPDGEREGFQVPRIRLQRVVVTLADAQEMVERTRTETAAERLPTAAQPAPPPTSEPTLQPTSQPMPEPSSSSVSRPAPGPTASSPTVTSPPPSVPPVTRPSTSPPPSVPTPTPSVEYRVQIEASRTFEPFDRRYAEARAIGELSSDPVPKRGLYRVLVGHYGTLSEARDAMARARAAGWGDAFVAKIEGGVYRGAVQ